ncbi:hypothetical protein D9M72_400490 [compost metagenome]
MVAARVAQPVRRDRGQCRTALPHVVGSAAVPARAGKVPRGTGAALCRHARSGGDAGHAHSNCRHRQHREGSGAAAPAAHQPPCARTRRGRPRRCQPAAAARREAGARRYPAGPRAPDLRDQPGDAGAAADRGHARPQRPADRNGAAVGQRIGPAGSRHAAQGTGPRCECHQRHECREWRQWRQWQERQCRRRCLASQDRQDRHRRRQRARGRLPAGRSQPRPPRDPPVPQYRAQHRRHCLATDAGGGAGEAACRIRPARRDRHRRHSLARHAGEPPAAGPAPGGSGAAAAIPGRPPQCGAAQRHADRQGQAQCRCSHRQADCRTVCGQRAGRQRAHGRPRQRRRFPALALARVVGHRLRDG